MKYKYDIEIEVDSECDNYDRFASYDLLCAYGNTLEELLDNASIGIMDQDGGEIDQVPADEDWMQSLVEEKYNELVAKETK